MKTIKAIDDHMEDINAELLDDEAKKRLPTYRMYFKAALGLSTSVTPIEAIDYFALGQKIKESGPDLELENSEFATLKKCVEANPVRWPVIFYSQMVMKLREAEKEPPKMEVK